MDLDVGPVGGGLAFRILRQVLSLIAGRKEPVVSESELVQITRLAVVGNVNPTILVAPTNPDRIRDDRVRERRPSTEDQLVEALVNRCFAIAAHYPGLSVTFSVSAQGDRSIRIDSPGVFKPPSEEELETAIIVPPRPPLPPSFPRSGPAPPPKDATATEYAEYAWRLMEHED